MNARRLGLRLPGWSVVALLAARASPLRAMGCPSHRPDAAAQSEPWAPPLDRVVSARSSGSLRDALDRIAASARLRLSYSADLLPLDRAACVSADRQPVGRLLAQLLDGTGLRAIGLGGDQVVLAPRRDTTRDAAPAPGPAGAELNVLDRVVVTGSATAAGRPERELAVGLTTIDGRRLARDNTDVLGSALDDYVPGVWAWAQSPSTMGSAYASMRGASSFGLSYPKVYIDGIEVANPLLLTRFNPGSIDHIEVIRGPQGSALYGTDAISGVVNIVTRHDGAPPDGAARSLRSTVGVSQSSFANGVLTQDHSLSVAAGTAARSADLHVAGGGMGSFIPGGYSRDLMATAGTRVIGEAGSLSGTARFFLERAGSPSSPLIPARAGIGADSAAPQSMSEYTLGATGTTAVDSNWTMSLVAGIDGYRLNDVQASTVAPVQTLLDSALRAAEGGADRATLRASSVYQMRPSAWTRGSFTVSLEHTTLRVTSFAPPVDAAAEARNPAGHGEAARVQGSGRLSVVGAVPATPAAESRVVAWQNSTGLVAQTNLALADRLFLTGGVRFERDSRLAGVDQLETLPMLGASYVVERGPVTVKLRSAYGEGLRAPTTPARVQAWNTRDARLLAENGLGPERQAGIESGVDVFIRRAFSFQATHFDQRASGLVQLVGVPADTARYSRRWVPIAENVGQIANRGWELQGAAGRGPLALSGTMTFTDSRVQKLAGRYTGDLITGARTLAVPARTESLNATWTASRWRASVGASRALDWINYDQRALAAAAAANDVATADLTGPALRAYWRRYDGGTRLRASASRDLRGMFTFEISGENLLNYQLGEPDNVTIIPGRTLMTGLSVRF